MSRLDEMEHIMSTTEQLLDGVDIMAVAKEHHIGNYSQTIEELMDILEERLKPEVEKHPELEGYLFNATNEEEFAMYLERRYKDQFHSFEVTNRYYNFD